VAEPGVVGYIRQRMLSAKNEQHAVLATLLYNVTHYALRPWPWIIIALVSLVMYPMTISNNGSGMIKMAPDTEDFLFEHVSREDVSRLGDVIQVKLNETDEADKKANYNRLMSIVDNNTDSPEVQSLAYIMAEKNEGKEDLATWSDPLEEEGLVRLHLQKPRIEIS